MALQVCSKAPQGSTVLAMIPDTAERYLSTPLFAEIDAEMDASEVEIAKSTPSAVLEAERGHRHRFSVLGARVDSSSLPHMHCISRGAPDRMHHVACVAPRVLWRGMQKK